MVRYKILDLRYMVLERTADSRSLRDLLQCMGLIIVASEKLNVFVCQHVGEKGISVIICFD